MNKPAQVAANYWNDMSPAMRGVIAGRLAQTPEQRIAESRANVIRMAKMLRQDVEKELAYWAKTAGLDAAAEVAHYRAAQC